MKFIKNSFAEFMQNKTILVWGIIILLTCQFAIQYRGALWPKLYMLIVGAVFVVALFLIRVKDPKKIARNGFLIIVLFGLCDSLITPVRQDLDENHHYYNAMQLADGKFRIQSTEMDFLEISPDFLTISGFPSRPETGEPTNTNLYYEAFMSLEHQPSNYQEDLLTKGNLISPSYYASGLGIAVGRLLSNKVAFSYYMGRFFNLLSFALLAYLAIKISKVFKLQLLVMATLPYALWITAGFNYDSLYYGLALLAVSLFTNILHEKKLTPKSAWLYGLVCVGFVTNKVPVFLLIFLLLFLPKSYYSKQLNRLKAFFITIFYSIIGGAWLVQGIFFRLLGESSAKVALGNDQSLFSRIAYFVSHPAYTIGVILRGISELFLSIIGWIGKPQPYNMPSQTLWIINVGIFLLLFIMISYNLKISLSKNMYIVTSITILIIGLASIFAISGDIRVFELGDLYVSGVQGRYFYFLFGFLPLLLGPLMNKMTEQLGISVSGLNTEVRYTMIVKIILLITFFNTCMGMYGFL
ncbi:DUF2142 domain-containing protein [Enterococcus sp. LJL90]